jgi:hypothetical protein
MRPFNGYIKRRPLVERRSSGVSALVGLTGSWWSHSCWMRRAAGQYVRVEVLAVDDATTDGSPAACSPSTTCGALAEPSFPALFEYDNGWTTLYT